MPRVAVRGLEGVGIPVPAVPPRPHGQVEIGRCDQVTMAGTRTGNPFPKTPGEIKARSVYSPSTILLKIPSSLHSPTATKPQQKPTPTHIHKQHTTPQHAAAWRCGARTHSTVCATEWCAHTHPTHTAHTAHIAHTQHGVRNRGRKLEVRNQNLKRISRFAQCPLQCHDAAEEVSRHRAGSAVLEAQGVAQAEL